MTSASTHRLFFALWPDDEVREALVKGLMQTPQYQMHGRIMDPANLHITLHFIGNVSSEQKDCLRQAAQSIRGEAFKLRLDYYGHFYRARVFWMGCRQVPDELKNLYQELGVALERCNYQMERRPYAPHVTLMRKLNRPGDMPQPQVIEWPVRAFALVQSETQPEGVRYKVMDYYPLQVTPMVQGD